MASASSSGSRSTLGDMTPLQPVHHLALGLIEKAEGYSAGATAEDLANRLLSELGEAVRNVDSETKADSPDASELKVAAALAAALGARAANQEIKPYLTKMATTLEAAASQPAAEKQDPLDHIGAAIKLLAAPLANGNPLGVTSGVVKHVIVALDSLE